MKLFRNIFSKKQEISPIFSKQADFLCETSAILVQMISSDQQSEWEKYEREIKEYEVQGDALLAEFTGQLSNRLIVPIRKIDLQSLAMALDDCLDVVKDCAKAILIYKPKKIDSQLKELARLVKDQAEALKKIMDLLPQVQQNLSEITLQCERVTELEHEADDEYEDYIGYIFDNEDDVKELTKYKNLAEVLESTTDCAKTASDTVRRLIIINFTSKK